MKKFIVIAAAVLISGCSDSTGAKRALEQSGYSDIQTTGYSFFGCDKNDAYHTGFIAKGPTGKPVEGVVCSGVFKGSTVRLD